MRGKPLVLLALLGLLVVSIAYAFWMTPHLQKAAPRKSVASPRFTEEAVLSNTMPRLRVDLLTAEPKPFPGARRDIFNFRSSKRKIPVRSILKPVKSTPRAVVAESSLQPIPLQLVHKELSRFTFLGFVDRSGEKTVFLSSGGDLYVVKKNESFGRELEFRVEDIAENQLVVVRSGLADQVVIPLIENMQLAPAVSTPAAVRISSSPTREEAQLSEPAAAGEDKDPVYSDIQKTDGHQKRPGDSNNVFNGDADGTNK